MSLFDPTVGRLHLIGASAGTIVHPPGEQVGPRVQRDVMLLLVLSGGLRLRVDAGEDLLLRPRSVCLLRPGQTEELRFSESQETEEAWIRGHLGVVSSETRGRFDGLPQTLPLSAALSSLTREATLAELSRLAARNALVDALATAALWQYIAEAETNASPFPEALERARQHIDSHFEDPLELADIAREAAVTPAHLIRLFREHFHTTPMRYVWDRRIALGVELLRTTGLPVGTIAERCGFKTSFHFARRIRQATGQTPTELRVGR